MVKGPVVIGIAQALSLIAVVLLVFAHLGQINTGSLPYRLGMVSMNVTQFGACLQNSTGDPFPGMYQTNASAPLGDHAGLRDIYSWGFFSHCAYIVSNTTAGSCTNTTFGYPFTPLDTMLSDILLNSSTISQFTIPQTTSFTNSPYLGSLSHAGFFLIFIGMLCAFLAAMLAIRHSRFTFAISAVLIVLATLLVMVGSALWTTLVQSAMQINSTTAAGGSCLGIALSHGPSQWLVWGAFALLILSVPPYIISYISYHRAARPNEVRLDRHVSGRRYKDPTYRPPRARSQSTARAAATNGHAVPVTRANVGTGSGMGTGAPRPAPSRQPSQSSTPTPGPGRPTPSRQPSQVSTPARPRPAAERHASSYNTYPGRAGAGTGAGRAPPPTRQMSQSTLPTRRSGGPAPPAPVRGSSMPPPARQASAPARKGTYG